MSKDITVVIGPTGIGKTDYALELAKKTGSEIISADAYQVYRGMDIGTAKVSIADRTAVPHHLIDILDPSDAYSVAQFLDRSANIIDGLRSRNIPVIVCGGTAFYIHAFLHQFDFSSPSNDRSYRDRLMADYRTFGSPHLWQQLHTIDPNAASMIDPNNWKRLIRSLEIAHATGELPSKLRQAADQIRPDVNIIGLCADRGYVIDRIHCRVDQMIANGLIDEVRHLLGTGLSSDALALEAIGYKQVIPFLNGSIDREEMIELIKIRTRQFSKRQMTWFRRYKNVTWINVKQ